MNQNLLSSVLEFLRRKMWSKRWQRALTCLAAVVVFGVTYALIMPAITLTNVHPTLFAEQFSAWSGDELTVKVTAEADEDRPAQTFVLKAEGEGADLSASYEFNEEGICVITDDEGKEIELHRSIREGKKDVVDYWFTLEPGTETAFTLSLTDEVDESRFAELVQAVKQEREESDDNVTASASDAGKSETAAPAVKKTANATASDAVKASVSNADIAEANAAAKNGEEKIVTEKDDDGFEQILDGAIVNDLEAEDDEEDAAATEVVANLKLSAGLGSDYEEAVRDAEKNADKRGDAEVKLSWKDVVAAKAGTTTLYSSVNGANISVFFDDAAEIPEGASLVVEEFEKGSPEYEEYLAQARSAVENTTGGDAPKTVGNARFFDITIVDESGNEVEPASQVKVVISYDEAVSLTDDGGLNVVHFKDDAPELFQPGSTEGDEAEVKALSFTTDSFSVYGIVSMETLTARYLTADGEEYSITLSYGPEAGIPADAELKVTEITEGTSEYDAYMEKASAALGEENKPAAVRAAKLFDITILSDGKEIEPKTAVEVSIRNFGAPEVRKKDEVNAVHFTDKKAEVINVREEAESGRLNGVSFQADSFSVYAIVIVDTLPEGEYLTKTFEDEKWVVKAAYTENAGIPAEAELRVSELTKEKQPAKYAENEKLVMEYDEESVIYAMMDIGFWVGDKEIEPETTVYVTIKFKDTEKYKEGAGISILHREENKDELSCVAVTELNEELETSYEVDSFSLFIITNQGTIEWLQYTTATQNYDPDWVSRGGTVKNFTDHLPLGTAAITKSMAVSNRTSFETNNSNRFKISGGYVQSNLVNTPGKETEYPNDWFTVTWADAVTLQDGRTADLRVTGKNMKSRSASGWMNHFSGGGVAINKTGGGVCIDLEYSVCDKNGDPVKDENGKNYTLLFGVTDIDQPDRVNNYTYYQVQKATDAQGGLIGVQYNGTPGTVRYSEPLTDQDAQNGKIQLANASKQRLYWTDSSETATTTENTGLPVYALYKVLRSNGSTLRTGDQTSTVTGSDNDPSSKLTTYGNVFVTRQPLVYAEAVSIDGMQSKMYIPDHNYLHFEVRDGLKTAVSIKDDSSAGSGAGGTAATGFFALVDSESYTIRYTGSNGIGIGLTSGTAYYKIISTTGEGGNITTTDTDISGNLVTYGPGLLAVPKGKTVTYTMSPENFYRAKTVTIWDTTQVADNRTVMPIGDLLDEEGYEAVDGQTYQQKTVTVPYKDESDEYGHLGTEATATFVIRKAEDGTLTVFNENGEQVLSFTNNGGNCTITDTKRNVSYELVVNSNKTLNYTFVKVAANHWIDVRWEKEPAAESLILVKKWSDSGNARGTRPGVDALAVHVKRESGKPLGSVQGQAGDTPTEITELITCQDPGIEGSTDWVPQDGDTWTYTYSIPAGVEDLLIYEDEVADYDGDHVGEAGKLDVTDYTEEEDPTTGQLVRIYKATVSNAIAPGTLEFTKAGEKINSEEEETSPLAGAVFTLYTDRQCQYPLTRKDGTGADVPVTAQSGTDGKVVFGDVNCGMYFMKETTSPENYDNNDSVYQVYIHKDAKDSTVTVITRDPDGTGILIGNTEEGYTIVNKLAKFDVIMMKVDANNQQKRLPSALFVLYGSDYIDEQGNINPAAAPLSSPIEASKWYDANVGTSTNTRYGNIKSEEENTFFSSRNGNQNNMSSVYGKAPLGKLKVGTYYLVELGAPAGFDLPRDPVSKIVVEQSGVRAGSRDGVTRYNVTYVINSGVYTYTVAVPNNLGKELPHTGGPGTGLYTLGGIMLLIASALLYGFRMRREERRCS